MGGTISTFGVIDDARERAGMSVDELAVRTGIARSTLQRRLMDESGFRVTELRKIARVLDGDLAEWVTKIGEAA